MGLISCCGRVEQLDGNAVFLILQCGISGQLAALSIGFLTIKTQRFRQVTKIPLFQAGLFDIRRCTAEGQLSGLPQLLPERIPVATHAQLAILVIHHAEVHAQVLRQFPLPVVHTEFQPGTLLDITGQLRQQSPFGNRIRLQKGRDEIRHRHANAAISLGQRLDQPGQLVTYHARHQPLRLRGIQLVEQCQRYGGRHTVERMARFEAVFEFDLGAIQQQLLRELLLGDRIRTVAHQVIACQVQQPWLALLRSLAPGLETDAVEYVLADTLVVKTEKHMFIDQHVLPSGLVFQRFDFRD